MLRRGSGDALVPEQERTFILQRRKTPNHTPLLRSNIEMGRAAKLRCAGLAQASPALPEDCVLVLDLEGTDGRERGPDDTTFERQSALLALAAADVLLVNLWCHDIGREHGAGKPLLRTVLQENLKLFGGGPRGRRTALLFVIRDRSPRTPLDLLCRTLREDLESIWAQIGKPQALKEALRDVCAPE